MAELPKELTITEEDLAGDYADHLDCPLARALKRAGVTLSLENGYAVGGTFILRNGLGEPGTAGFYAWDTGETFCPNTLREGKLIYHD